MILIECPWCGLRDEEEFSCGGQSHIVRPPVPSDVSDVQWSSYLYDRENPKGLHRERWKHTFGCGQWFNVERDTVTHEITRVYPMSEEAPYPPEDLT